MEHLLLKTLRVWQTLRVKIYGCNLWRMSREKRSNPQSGNNKGKILTYFSYPISQISTHESHE
jgi:hypothetical protein